MDLSLPEMDGWTATKSLKSDPETKYIPIVALTAHTLPSDRKRATAGRMRQLSFEAHQYRIIHGDRCESNCQSRYEVKAQVKNKAERQSSLMFIFEQRGIK